MPKEAIRTDDELKVHQPQSRIIRLARRGFHDQRADKKEFPKAIWRLQNGKFDDGIPERSPFQEE